MKIIVSGKNISPQIELLPDEQSVQELFEKIKDERPIGEESTEQFNARNERLLQAMIRVFNLDEDAETIDEEGEESSFLLQPMLKYS
jgi:hypothetical protein